MAASEKKHMDIAKPGDIKIQTGSKPMVVGYKSTAADSTITTPETEKPDETTETSKIDLPSKQKIRIQPLTDEEKADTSSQSDENAANAGIDVEETTAENNVENEDSTVDNAKFDEKKVATNDLEDKNDEDTAVDEEKTPKEESPAAQEERLKELITSKEYFVPIKEHTGSKVRTFVITFLIALVTALCIVLILLDAGLLDLGIMPPTDFL